VTAAPSGTSSAVGTRSRTARPANLEHGKLRRAEFAYVSPLDPLAGYLVYSTVGNPDTGAHDGQKRHAHQASGPGYAYNAVKALSSDGGKAAMFKVQDIYVSDQNTYELPFYARKDVGL